jgi:hypothetical protein
VAKSQLIRKWKVLLVLITALSLRLDAQGPPGGRGAAPPRSPREAAPVDFTGHWVSVVTEDWRWRMVTPARGDFAGVPLNPAARKLGLAWDPVKMETDAGTQTRLLRFRAGPSEGGPSWQGHSVAQWEGIVRGTGSPDFLPIGLNPREGTRGRSLEVVTTNLRPGYLRKNGVPYSARTTLREYYDLFTERNGDVWFTVTTIVEDPEYLTEPFVTSSNFKKQADATGWNPRPCTAR